MEAFAAAYGLVFLAELGDKSMFVVMTMATRYPWRFVLIAAAIATAAGLGLAVLFGEAIAAFLPTWVIALGAAAIFLGFGIKMLITVRNETQEQREAAKEAEGHGRRGVLMVPALAGAILVSELGDKSHIAVMTLSGLHQGDELLIWLGGVLGMMTVLALAIGLGSRITRILSPSTVEKLAAFAFLAFGVVALFVAAGEFET